MGRFVGTDCYMAPEALAAFGVSGKNGNESSGSSVLGDEIEDDGGYNSSSSPRNKNSRASRATGSGSSSSSVESSPSPGSGSSSTNDEFLLDSWGLGCVLFELLTGVFLWRLNPHLEDLLSSE